MKGKNLEPGTPIYLNDLLEAEDQLHVDIKPGNILLIRTGADVKNTPDKYSGLHPENLPWICEKKVSILGADGISDYYPNHFREWEIPFHGIGIPYIGLPLLDNAELDTLSKTCQ